MGNGRNDNDKHKVNSLPKAKAVDAPLTRGSHSGIYCIVDCFERWLNLNNIYLESMQEDKDKLDHLHSCQVSEISSSLIISLISSFSSQSSLSSLASPLPPEILLQAGSTGGQEVIEVHHHVHPGVQKWSKPALAATNKSDIT